MTPHDPKKGLLTGLFSYFVQAVLFSLAVTVTCYGGWKIWGIFGSLKKSSPPSSPSARTSIVLDEESDESDENALLEGVEETHLIEDEDPIEISSRLMEWESLEGRIAQKEKFIEYRNKMIKDIEERFDAMRVLGVGKQEIEEHPDYETLDQERRFRENERVDLNCLLLEMMFLEERYPQIKLLQMFLEDRYPQIKLLHKRNIVSSFHLPESAYLLSSDDIVYLKNLKKWNTQPIRKVRSTSSKRARHQRRIQKRLRATTVSKALKIRTKRSTTTRASNSGNLRISSGTEDSGPN